MLSKNSLNDYIKMLKPNIYVEDERRLRTKSNLVMMFITANSILLRQLEFSVSLFKLALCVFKFCTNLITASQSKVVALLIF